MSRVYEYIVRHADDNMILSQRLSEYISRAPELEEDLAIANIALDHLGVAMHLYEYAAAIRGNGATADDLAFLRNEREYTNVLLVEQPNEDFAHIMARQWLFDAYQAALWRRLAGSADETLAGIAAKAAKETAYHLRHSSGWMIRLGDGTSVSHDRAQAAIDSLWRYVDELFATDALDTEMAAAGVGIDPSELRPEWEAQIDADLTKATLRHCDDDYQRVGGRTGYHTEHLGHLLSEMQWMQRSYPGLQW